MLALRIILILLVVTAIQPAIAEEGRVNIPDERVEATTLRSGDGGTPSREIPGGDSAFEVVTIGGEEGVQSPRAADVPSAVRFSDNGDGTVLDADTGLMWVKDANVNGGRVPWQVAKEYIKEMNSGKRENYGYSDWRLPRIEELVSLLDTTMFYPAVSAGHPFENIQTKHYYWSSSGGFNVVGYAWLADFASGNIKYDIISYCSFQYFWPVRTSGEPGRNPLAGNRPVRQSPSDAGLSFEDLACKDNSAQPPRVPVGLTATAVSPYEIVLSWNYEDDGMQEIAWYNIYEGTRFLKSVPGTYASFGSMRPGGVKCFSVSSYNALGLESSRSQPACAETWSDPADRTVWAEGLNAFGQLGDGTTEDRQSLVMTSGLKDVKKVAAGVEHAVAVRTDGTVWAWGRNGKGQLGNNSQEDSNVPVQVEGLSDVVDVAAGWYHTLALKSDGTVWAWGRNAYGQLGDATREDRMRPVRVAALSGIGKIAAGWYHSLAVGADGKVWAWGWNLKGQLGNGDRETAYVPVQVAGLKDVVGIDGGMYHSLAVKSNGEVWTWGWNEFGQLGDGTTLDSPFPVKVRGIRDAVEVAGGMHFSVSLSADGTVWAWGRNDYGQMGNFSYSHTTAPVQVQGLEGFSRVTAGAHHAVAIKSDGTLWAWGWNYADKRKQSLPKRISGLTGITEVAAGIHFTAALMK